MDEWTINEVISEFYDFEREWRAKDDVDSFNQAIMRLRKNVEDLCVIDSFDEVREDV